MEAHIHLQCQFQWIPRLLTFSGTGMRFPYKRTEVGSDLGSCKTRKLLENPRGKSNTASKSRGGENGWDGSHCRQRNYIYSLQEPGGSAHVRNEGLIVIWSRWFSFTFLSAVFPWEQRADAEPGAVHVINSDPAPQWVHGREYKLMIPPELSVLCFFPPLTYQVIIKRFFFLKRQAQNIILENTESKPKGWGVQIFLSESQGLVLRKTPIKDDSLCMCYLIVMFNFCWEHIILW